MLMDEKKHGPLVPNYLFSQPQFFQQKLITPLASATYLLWTISRHRWIEICRLLFTSHCFEYLFARSHRTAPFAAHNFVNVCACFLKIYFKFFLLLLLLYFRVSISPWTVGYMGVLRTFVCPGKFVRQTRRVRGSISSSYIYYNTHRTHHTHGTHRNEVTPTAHQTIVCSYIVECSVWSHKSDCRIFLVSFLLLLLPLLLQKKSWLFSWLTVNR